MQIREYSLQAGWYPRNPDEAVATITRFLRESGLSSDTAQIKSPSRAAIAPHAGWFYSGRIAAAAVSALEKSAETVAVLGGHLPAGYPVLFAMEDAVRTPFGLFPIDTELRSILREEMDGSSAKGTSADNYRDNTVEVLLPMIRYFFPQAALLWLRLPAEIASFKAGEIISRAAADLGRKINVLSSTDLTHYGENYGFMPHGRGSAALRWVREVNDAAFIKAVESGNAGEVLRFAQEEQSACSAGAVLGAMGFAKAEGLGVARLLEYATSADVHDGSSCGVPSSFVGYAAMAFQ